MIKTLGYGMRMLRVVLAMVGLLLPLGSHSAPEAFFPFGVYDKTDMEPGGAEWEAYYHRLFAILADTNINTVLTRPYKSVDQTLFILDLASEQGVKVILGVGNPLSRKWDFAGPGYPFHRAYTHPGVIAIKYSDEPTTQAQLDNLVRQYAALRKHYPVPVVTAMVGEHMTGEKGDFVLDAWKELDARVKFARFYPIRRTYNLGDWYRDKMALPFHEWCAVMESSLEGRPWWYILQAFGKGREKSYASYWRYPTARELSAMVHIALAHGARGIIAFSLQRFDARKKPTRVMLLDEDLKPMAARDGSVPINKYRELGALTQAHASLLLRHQRDTFPVTVDEPDVLSVPRRDPETGTKFIYLVNRNTDQRRSGRVSFELDEPVAEAMNIYTGDTVAVTGVEREKHFRYELAAGDGQLWALESVVPSPGSP